MFQMSLNRVHDTVRVHEGNENIILKVNGDPMRMVAGLSQAQKMLKALNAESTEEERDAAAMYFAQVIFGKEQAERLKEFYHQDAECVVLLCGRYFSGRLSKLITQAQKRNRVKK